ncbi:MAG: MFS transporter [Candidatus Hodarchaeota archaeon]
MTLEESIERTRATTKKNLTFALPNLSTSLVMGFADFALFTLYAKAYELNTFLVGIALALGKLAVASSQFFFGWLSDSKYTKWGRRKPYLVILSPILMISFLLLLLPILVIDYTNTTTLFSWLLLWNIIFNLSYGITSPYLSWMAEQFTVEDRPKASQFLSLFGFIGTAVMSIFSLLVLTDFDDKLKDNPNTIPPEFFYSVLIFSLLPSILFYTVTFLIPTEPQFKIESKMIQNLKIILKNKNFLLVTVMQGICSVAFIMIGQTMLLFTEIVLQLKDMDYYIVAGLMIIGIIVAIYIWRKLIERFGKKQTLLYVFLSAIIFLPTTLIGAIPMDSYLIFGIIFILGIAACLGGWFLFPNIMYADIAEDDEKETGELRAGIYMGFPSITLNIFQAIGLFLLGFILNLPKDLGYLIWGPICSIILIVAYFYTRRFIKIDFDWEERK